MKISIDLPGGGLASCLRQSARPNHQGTGCPWIKINTYIKTIEKLTYVPD